VIARALRLGEQLTSRERAELLEHLRERARAARLPFLENDPRRKS
jgi:hypothetical protein